MYKEGIKTRETHTLFTSLTITEKTEHYTTNIVNDTK